MASARPLNHSLTSSIDAPTHPSPKRLTFHEKKEVIDTSMDGDKLMTTEDEPPTFQELMKQAMLRGQQPASLPSGQKRRVTSYTRGEKAQSSLKSQKTTRAEPLRDNYFDCVQQPGFGINMIPKFMAEEKVSPALGHRSCFRINMSQKTFSPLGFPQLLRLMQKEIKKGSQMIFEAQNLDPDQIHEMFSILDLQPVVASECSLFHSIDKLDLFDPKTFIIHTAVVEDDDRDLNFFEPIRIFRHHGLLIILSKKDFSLVDILEQKLGYFEQDTKLMMSFTSQESSVQSITPPSQRKSTLLNLTSSHLGLREQSFQTLIFVVLFNVIKALEPFVELMLRQANRVQRLALSLSYNQKLDYVRSLGTSQSLLSHLQQSLMSKKSLIQRLTTAASDDEIFTRQFLHLMRHLSDRILLQESILRKLKFQLQVTTETFQAHVDQTLNDFTNKLNNSMNLFAAIATLFLPLGLIAGIFGMNVHVPWQERTDEIWPFWVIIAIMGVIFFVLLAWVKCKKLI